MDDAIAEDGPDGRHYIAGGERFPSVSTVLAATAGRRWGLERWRAILGAEAAEDVAAIARYRGVVLHRQILQYLTTGEQPAELTTWWRSVWPTVRGLRAIGEVVMAERALVHQLDRYGGTPDLLLRIAGRLVLYDWKTSAERRPRPLLFEYEDQLAGYADLVEWEIGERPELAVVVVAIPEESAQEHPVPLPDALDRWRRRLADYRAAA